jgi:hypothetical protein
MRFSVYSGIIEKMLLNSCSMIHLTLFEEKFSVTRATVSIITPRAVKISSQRSKPASSPNAGRFREQESKRTVTSRAGNYKSMMTLRILIWKKALCVDFRRASKFDLEQNNTL